MTYETAEGGCWRGLKFYPKPKINDLKLCLVRVSRRQFLEHVILCVGVKSYPRPTNQNTTMPCFSRDQLSTSTLSDTWCRLPPQSERMN
jgi:hypothetical protein